MVATLLSATTFDAAMRAALPPLWTWGAVGAFDAFTDDRRWYIFPASDAPDGGARVGGFSTAERYRLIDVARGVHFALFAQEPA